MKDTIISETWATRILLGGARNKSFGHENTDSFDTTEIIQQELERFFMKQFCLAKHIGYRTVAGVGSWAWGKEKKLPLSKK
jgi:hypothetical protein